MEAYAAERAALLCGSYRRGDANDPDTYVAAVAAVLSMYDFEIIREATDPRFGISTTEKHRAFMPNSGEIKAFCEALAERTERLKKLAAIPRSVPVDRRLEAPEPPQGAWANIFVPEGHHRYARFVEWTKTAPAKFWKFVKSSDGRPGLWIPLDVWQGHHQAKPEKPASAPAKDWGSLKLRPETLAAMTQRIEPESETDAA